MNEVHPTAEIPEGVRMGKGNRIGAGVVVGPYKGEFGPVHIGDGNAIHEGVRILVGLGGMLMGDGNVVHNRCAFVGHGPLVVGDGCWVGQGTFLDCVGPLTIGDRVTIGFNCHVWTHVGRLPGWRDEAKPVVLGDEVWLVGDTVTVNPGVTMAPRSAALAHSVVTRDTQPGRVYAGIPARLKAGVRLDGTRQR